jgi:hypothetical protein
VSHAKRFSQILERLGNLSESPRFEIVSSTVGK